MSVTINGSGTISGITSGGLGSSPIITQPELVSGVVGTGPAFSATASGNQTLTTYVNTKVQFNTKVFDTASAYDNVTNYRFTPTVAGYYQVNVSVQIQGSASGALSLFIYKNGSLYNQLAYSANSAALNPMITGSILLFLNGSTDYIEIFAEQGSGINGTLYGTGAGGSNQFSASLVRTA